MRNTKRDSGKCKTIIQIDGVNVFTSDVYKWDPEPVSLDRTFEQAVRGIGIGTGDSWYVREGRAPEGSIRNLTVIAYKGTREYFNYDGQLDLAKEKIIGRVLAKN